MIKTIQNILDYLGFSNYPEKRMSDLKRLFFLILSFFPIIQFLSLEYLHRSFILLYGSMSTCLLLLYVIKGTNIKIPAYIIPYIILVVYYLGWDITNNKIGTYGSGFISYMYSNMHLYTVTTLLLIENTKFDQKFINSIILIFKFTIIAAFIVSVIQLIINPFFFTPQKLIDTYIYRGIYDIRRTSIFGYLSPSEVGKSMIPIVAIMIGYNLKKEKPLHPIWLILSSIVFIATNSRWVYLNLIVILIQYLLVKGINLKKVLKISFLIILGISSIYILLQFSGYNINSFIEERLLAKSAASRFLALEMFTKFFPKNPFFGTGIHVAEDLRRAISGRSSQIHVGYLSHLYEYGLVGSYFLFGAWFLITRNFHRVAKQTGYYGSLFAFIAFLVGNLTLVIYSVYCYGLLFAFIFNKMMNDTET